LLKETIYAILGLKDNSRTERMLQKKYISSRLKGDCTIGIQN